MLVQVPRRLSRFDLSMFDAACKQDFPIDERAKRTRFPFRLLRYWTASCAILEETRAVPPPHVLVDLGCERGLLKRFMPPARTIRWIGLDARPCEEDLRSVGYPELHRCDFDREFPLPDAVADIVAALHVFEHLPRPEFTLEEVARILRPGGLLVAETPILPEWMARLRRRQFSSQLARGRRHAWQHVNAFSPKLWRSLAERCGLRIEWMAGSHFWRWSGSRLESSRLWVRLNQLWGAAFPALGRNLFLQLRKPR